MKKMQIKLYRVDREPGGDHNYGEDMNHALDEMVGGRYKFKKVDGRPTAKIPGTDAKIELHEDGPLILFVIAQIPAIVSAMAALVSTWIAWKSTKRTMPKRSVKIKWGNHEYEGNPKSKKELKQILDFFKNLS